MRTLFTLLTLFIISSCIPTQEVVPKSSVGAINSSAPFLWYSSAFPIDLRISHAFTTTEVSNIRAMTAAWETAVDNKKNFFIDTNQTSEISSPSINLDTIGEDSVFGVYKINHWPLSLNSGALAVTQILGTRHNIGTASEHVRIIFADILLNDDLYDFRTGSDLSGGTYDLQTVMLHEMGHFLGLPHKYGSTVMVPSIGASTSNRAPTGVDATDLADKYGISLGSSSSAMSAGSRPTYIPMDEGKKVKILMELMPDGECIHKEDGVITKRHLVK